ncbi:MAG TPA: hypothetical protein PKM72_04395, partial [Nitrospirales bacterium]|nr:hypothetical protein [Nitrospirales bacterium]
PRNSGNLPQMWVSMLAPVLIGRSRKPNKLPTMPLRYNRRILTCTYSRMPHYRSSPYAQQLEQRF